MRRLYLPPEQLIPDGAAAVTAVEGEAHRYLSRVLRLAPGDRLVVFDGLGHEWDAEIAAITARATSLRLGEQRTTPPPRVAVTLLQAMPRNERMDLIVQKTTELGVARLVPVVSARSVAPPAGAGDSRLRRWRTIAQEAARQCGRADLPIIDAPTTLTAALDEAGNSSGPRLLVWEAAAEHSDSTPLRRAFTGAETAVTLLVGPEGGFEPGEAASARAAGFQVVGLGPRILRSETAALVAVALTQAALGELD